MSGNTVPVVASNGASRPLGIYTTGWQRSRRPSFRRTTQGRRTKAT